MRYGLCFAVVAVGFGWVVGCSGSAGDAGSTAVDNATPTEATTSASADAATESSSSSSSSSGSPAVTDSGTTDAHSEGGTAACLETCKSKNPQGATQFAAILVPCVCAPTACEAVCTACTSDAGTPDLGKLLSSAAPACKACVAKQVGAGGTCSKLEQQECPMQAQCPAFATCAQACK